MKRRRKNGEQSPAHAWLVDLINAAGKQLDAEKPDLAAVEVIYERRPDADVAAPSVLVSLAEQFKDGVPEPPRGPDLKSLPIINKAAGGMFGLWAIAGEPGLGKSSLARQIAVSARMRGLPVLDYDFENGPEIIAARLHQALEKAAFAEVTKRWYVRESIQTLDEDLAQVGEKAMIIVDSFQSLPAQVEHSTESLAKWMRRFERLARYGHFVLLISEKNREHYGEVHLAGFKGTGALEYKAWFGIQLLGDEKDEDAPIEVHVVKNRHRKTKGHICDLRRNPKKAFWFHEREVGGEDMD